MQISLNNPKFWQTLLFVFRRLTFRPRARHIYVTGVTYANEQVSFQF